MPQAAQTIVLFSDGATRVGDPPDQVLPEIRTNGVNVFTIGAGPDIDAKLLAKLSHVTGGTFFRVDPASSPDEQAFEVRTAFQEIAGLAHENTGAIDVAAIAVTAHDTIKHAVCVETGSRLATFAVSWMHAHDRIRLKLVSPRGAMSTIESPGNGVVVISGEHPFVGFRVSKPAPGQWTLQIEPEHLAAPTAARLFVFSENPILAGVVNASRYHYAPGEPVTLQLHTYYRGLVRSVRVQARVHAPGGAVLPLEFHDNLNPDSGVYQAVFRATEQPGVYTFEAAVTSDGKSAFSVETLSPDDERSTKPMPIPSFRRIFKTSVFVGVR